MSNPDQKWTERDVQGVLINPVYAITINTDLFSHHEPMVSKDQWVKANARLIQEYGPEADLRRLLEVLEGDYPRQPD